MSLSLEDVDGSDDLFEVLEIEVPTMSGHHFDMKSFSEGCLWQDATNERAVFVHHDPGDRHVGHRQNSRRRDFLNSTLFENMVDPSALDVF